MKEATGEMNMTVVTIIAIGAIVAFFWIMWPKIQETISGQWSDISAEKKCVQEDANGVCTKYE